MRMILMISIVLTTIIEASSGMYLIAEDGDAAKVMIRGNGERCSVELSSTGDIMESDCRIMTNSKNVKILCTRRKKICKTVNEVYNFTINAINSQASSTQEVGDSSYQRCLDNSVSTYDMRVCTGNELEYQDGLLNRYYKQAMRRLSREEKRKLRNAQRAWIKYRDAKCEAAGREMRGGTGELLLINECILDTTKVRAKELRDMI